MTEKQVGKVKWFDTKKGYGFILPEDGGGDVFVHVTDVKKAGMLSLVEGQQIEFVVAPDRRNGKSVATDLCLV